MDKQNASNSTLHQDTKDLLSTALQNSSVKDSTSSLNLLPSGVTKKLLGQLLRNATNDASDKLLVSEARHSSRPSNSRNDSRKLILSYEKRRLLEAVREFSNLLCQATDILESVISSYRISADDLHQLLNAVQTLPVDSARKTTANRDSQALYALRVKFQNVGSQLRALQDSVDSSNCISVSHLTNVIIHLNNCTRMLIRHLQTLNNRLLGSAAATCLSSLYSYARTIEQFLTELLSHSEFLITFAFSSERLPDERTSDGVKKLGHCVVLFRVEVVRSLEERRQLLSLMSELELKKRYQEADEAEKRKAQKQSRLVYHKPDFRPKGFLLPLPLARRREQMKQRRIHERSSQSISVLHSPTKDAAADSRVLELERRVAFLEEQVSSSIRDGGTKSQVQDVFYPIPTEPFRFPDVFETYPEDRVDVEEAKMDLMRMVFSEMSKPSDMSERAWQELVSEAIEELSQKISSICDEIIGDLFVTEIQKLPFLDL